MTDTIVGIERVRVVAGTFTGTGKTLRVADVIIGSRFDYGIVRLLKN